MDIYNFKKSNYVPTISTYNIIKSPNPTTRMVLLQMIQPWSRLNIQYEDVIVVNVDNRGSTYKNALNPH